MREYMTVKDLAKFGLTQYQASKAIRQANKELKEQGKLTFKGKAPSYKVKEVIGLEDHA